MEQRRLNPLASQGEWGEGVRQGRQAQACPQVSDIARLSGSVSTARWRVRGALGRAASQILGEQSSQDPPPKVTPTIFQELVASERLKKKNCNLPAAWKGCCRDRGLGPATAGSGVPRRGPGRLPGGSHFLPRCLYSTPGAGRAKWPPSLCPA